MSLSKTLVEYVSACFTGLWVISHEQEDALREIAGMCRDQDWRMASWDVERGLQVPGSDQPVDSGGSDPLAAIRSINALASADSSALLVMSNFHRFMNSAEVVQALAHQINLGKQNRTFLVVLSPVVEIPTELEKLFVVVETAQAGGRRLHGGRDPKLLPPGGLAGCLFGRGGPERCAGCPDCAGGCREASNLGHRPVPGCRSGRSLQP